MTEEEWLASRDVVAMIAHIPPSASARKGRLLGCACVRWAWEWGLSESVPEAVQTIEAYADGSSTRAALRRAANEMKLLRADSEEAYRPFPRTCELTEALASPRCQDGLWELAGFVADMHITDDPEWARTAEFARDIWGNPFRPVALDPAWLSSDVVALARGIYADRAFDRMPILADALQDAGCEHPDVLNHCRADTVHVRGCWVVDLVLGKQ
jgi:hypothetical protein